MTAGSRDKVVVIGGGVIGAMCAWYLVDSGHSVTVIDKGKFGAGCSHGNCGFVSTSHVLPLPQPGAIVHAIPALFNPNSPLCIRWKWSPALWSWLWRFSRRCNLTDMLEAAIGRHELLQSSLELYKRLINESGIDCEWQERGLLFVCKSRSHFDKFGETNELLTDEFGLAAQAYRGNALTTLEPALKDGLAGAWYYPEDCHLRSDKLLVSLRRHLEDRGTRFIEQFEVENFFYEKRGCRAVGNSQSEIEADAFVVATGAWSPFLNKHLGCKLPIQPGKGYSITMPHPARMPQIPMILEERRVAITPLKNKYRIGSTMEFAGYDNTIHQTRLDLLKSSAKLYLHEPYCQPIEEEWYGWRPMTWDGKPFIDQSPAMENVWIAAGHNMLGISLATGTGKLIQEMINGEEPHVNADHYCLARLKNEGSAT